MDGFANHDEASAAVLPTAPVPEPRLDAADELLIEALANGATYAEAGDLADVSARTVRRRMADPAFAAEVAKRRTERLSMVSGRLSLLAQHALDVLEQKLGSAHPGEALRAADMVLSLDRRYREQVDFAARLLAVEEGLAPGRASNEAGDE